MNSASQLDVYSANQPDVNSASQPDVNGVSQPDVNGASQPDVAGCGDGVKARSSAAGAGAGNPLVGMRGAETRTGFRSLQDLGESDDESADTRGVLVRSLAEARAAADSGQQTTILHMDPAFATYASATGAQMFIIE